MKEACETLLLHGGTKRDIAKAGRLLAAGEVVAVPTETVYGLAANALDEQAVLRIFEAKGRPQDNPLIVHVSALEQIDPLVTEFPAVARALARRFWPGPMTLVMKKSPRIPDRTSAGLDTVGIRMPAHPVARAIIDAAGVPLAAPSANISGKPSPTTAADVMDFNQQLNARMMTVADKAVEEREYRPFSKVRDNFPQYLLTLDPLPLERDGVTYRHLIELMASGGDL